MSDYQHGPSSTVRQRPQRGAYDRDLIHGIIDACPICHIGIVDDGVAVVIPTIAWRIGSDLYVHGSSRSRLICVLASGARACLTFTRLDGLVLARSAFAHSMNYRAVVAFGCGILVEDDNAKQAALAALMEWMVPGRQALVRAPSAAELQMTAVVRIPINEASAKIRSGPPNDPPADRSWPVWAGVVGRNERWGTAIPVGDCPPDQSPPVLEGTVTDGPGCPDGGA